jgi:hypothetical protein
MTPRLFAIEEYVGRGGTSFHTSALQVRLINVEKYGPENESLIQLTLKRM